MKTTPANGAAVRAGAKLTTQSTTIVMNMAMASAVTAVGLGTTMNWLPKHDCGLYLEHNAHKDVYESVEEYTDHWDGDWISDEERAKAIETNEVWRLQWYPNTPVGFYVVMASGLEAIIGHLKTEKFD